MITAAVVAAVVWLGDDGNAWLSAEDCQQHSATVCVAIPATAVTTKGQP